VLLDALRRQQAVEQLAALAPRPGLEVDHAAPGVDRLAEAHALLRVRPHAQLVGAAAEHLAARPAEQALVGFVDVQHDAVIESHETDCRRTAAEQLLQQLLAAEPRIFVLHRANLTPSTL